MFFNIGNMELSAIKRDMRVTSPKVGDSIFVLDEEINECVDCTDGRTHTSGLTPI